MQKSKWTKRDSVPLGQADIPLKLGSDQVNIQTENGDNLLNAEPYVILKWHFSDLLRNTFPNNAKVDIELWKVSLNRQSQLEKNKQPITLKEKLLFYDSARLQLSGNISHISVCFIRVVVHANSQTYAALNTGLLIVRKDSSLSTKLCQDWVVQQPESLTSNEDNLLLCPQTLQQMRVAAR